MIERHDIISELIGLYDEENLSSYTHGEFKGLFPDVRIELSDDQFFLFKVEEPHFLMESTIAEQWQEFDETYEEWWLCVPYALWSDAEDMAENLGLNHVNFCAWSVDEIEQIWFHDMPFFLEGWEEEEDTGLELVVDVEEE